MIVCLGWGSLIWDPRNLLIESGWYPDGPKMPLEFSRQSTDGRLTLVIDTAGTKLPVLWAKMRTDKLDEAVESLREREKCPTTKPIGSWRIGKPVPPNIPDLESWTKRIGASSVIWTALRMRFKNTLDQRPTVDEAIKYLESLDTQKMEMAREYIEKAPQQITTEYRKAFESKLGWSSIS